MAAQLKESVDSVDKQRQIFGKPGRPVEDRLLRQRQIFEAVAPLLERTGARRLLMSEAARAAVLSVGGLYHYFPTKRDLVLHGLNRAALERRCADFWARCGPFEGENRAVFLDMLVDAFIGKLRFVRPSVAAARELGLDPFGDGFEAFVEVGIGRFADALLRVSRSGSQRPDLFHRTVRRLFFGALLDSSVTAAEVRAELYLLARGRPLAVGATATHSALRAGRAPRAMGSRQLGSRSLAGQVTPIRA